MFWSRILIVKLADRKLAYVIRQFDMYVFGDISTVKIQKQKALMMGNGEGL